MAKKKRAARKKGRASERKPGADSSFQTPYTLYLPDGDGPVAADLEPPAPMPRVGDMVEYVDPAGVSRWYVVRDVVHTVEAAPGTDPASIPLLRAGIPAVYLRHTHRKPPRAS
jgi:hypothetical protein